MKPRLGLFFDGANHTETLSKAKVRIDYHAFYRGLMEHYEVVSARYYTGISDEPNHKGVRDFLGALARGNYVLVTKPVRKLPDGQVKANMDIEMAVDLVTMAPKLDKVFLFTGDGDFIYAVDYVQRLGVHVTLCSTKENTANDLKDQCNDFVDIKVLGLPGAEKAFI